MDKISITLVLLIIISGNGFSQIRDASSIRLMFYNVENFFDTDDDSLKEDDDFLPHGLMKWNYTRYWKKVNSIYQTIVAAGEWEPPAIIGFCEIEKRSVLEDVITDTYLSKYDYGIVHEESPDPRGIDVCFIYRKDLISVLDYKHLVPADINKNEFKTRNVLYARIMLPGDTIHLFINHWPSRRGGVLAGEPIRMSLSLMLNGKVDSILEKANGKAKIIVAGDFNSTPDDREILTLLKTNEAGNKSKFPLMINLSEKTAGTSSGSYRYMGVWEMLDQILVSDWLISCTNGSYTGLEQFRVFKPEFLLKRDNKYPGLSPFSTYSGYRYQGGFSDHLPVILDLKIRKIN